MSFAGLWGRTSTTLGMIKISHTIFALPFALASLLLASEGRPSPAVLGWVLLAMVTARSAAMAFNRLVDRHFDLENPRTRERALPAGQVSSRFVGWFVACNAGLFVLAAGMLNPLCLALSPVALLVVLGYSFAKRFTALCHLWLGVALGLTPLAGWVAVRGVVDQSVILPMLLAVGVMFWVTGFDVIYACQDADFDRRAGLHSLPARIGVRRALVVAALFHGVTLLAFGGAGVLAELHSWYRWGWSAVAVLLLVEHVLAWPVQARRLKVAFFHVNALVGPILLAAVAGELYA
jgi:4-hydroxybenzoate polyprenyltransferase